MPKRVETLAQTMLSHLQRENPLSIRRLAVKLGEPGVSAQPQKRGGDRTSYDFDEAVDYLVDKGLAEKFMPAGATGQYIDKLHLQRVKAQLPRGVSAAQIETFVDESKPEGQDDMGTKRTTEELKADLDRALDELLQGEEPVSLEMLRQRAGASAAVWHGHKDWADEYRPKLLAHNRALNGGTKAEEADAPNPGLEGKIAELEAALAAARAELEWALAVKIELEANHNDLIEEKIALEQQLAEISLDPPLPVAALSTLDLLNEVAAADMAVERLIR